MSNRYLIFDEIKTCVERFIAETRHSDSMDLQPLLFQLTSDTTMYLMFGETASASRSSHCQNDLKAFYENFSKGQEYLSYRSRMGNFYWLINTLGFNQVCRSTQSYIDSLVQRALHHSRQSEVEQTADPQPAFMNAMMDRTKDKGILRDQCLNVLLAGRDTTASCLSWTM